MHTLNTSLFASQRHQQHRLPQILKLNTIPCAAHAICSKWSLLAGGAESQTVERPDREKIKNDYKKKSLSNVLPSRRYFRLSHDDKKATSSPRPPPGSETPRQASGPPGTSLPASGTPLPPQRATGSRLLALWTPGGAPPAR